jgi:hypothetical protein
MVMNQQKTMAEQRRQRLARALKQNITRRKEQAKLPPRVPDPPPEPAPDDNGCPN